MVLTPARVRNKRRKLDQGNGQQQLDTIVENVIKGLDSTIDGKLATLLPEDGSSSNNLTLLIEKIMEKLIPKIDEMIERKLEKYGLTTSNLERRQFGQPPTMGRIEHAQATVNMLHKKNAEEELLTLFEKKKYYAVIERLPEGQDETEDTEQMNSSVDQVVNSAAFDCDKKFEVKRHGKKINNRPRIIKVKFGTQQAASLFIQLFRQVHKPKKGEHSPFARRDLTPPELQLQNHLKQQVAEYNKQHGPGAATYRDLKIFYKKH